VATPNPMPATEVSTNDIGRSEGSQGAPTIPHLQTVPAYWELRELLAKRGVMDDRPDTLECRSSHSDDRLPMRTFS
jgi:hypothetical protein